MKRQLEFNSRKAICCRFGPVYPIGRMFLPRVTVDLNKMALIAGGRIIPAEDIVSIEANVVFTPCIVTITYGAGSEHRKLRIYPGVNFIRDNPMRCVRFLKRFLTWAQTARKRLTNC